MTFAQEDRSILQKATSSVLVPAQNDVSVDAILQDAADIVQRSTIFFDERLRVLVCLDIPACPEEKVNSYLKSLELRVDAWAITSHVDSQVPTDGTASPPQDLIGSEVITKLEDPFTLVKQGTEDGQLVMQLVWEVTISLGRPRVRIHDPSIAFIPVAAFTCTQTTTTDEEYLNPFATSESNVLEPLKGMPNLAVHPYLPVSRLEKVLPLPPKKDEKISVPHQEFEPIPAHPVVMPRLKYTRIQTLKSVPVMIASLDIDINPVIEIKGTIESIDMNMMSGKVTSLMPGFLPVSFKSRDGITFLYNLKSSNPSNSPTTGPPMADPTTPGELANANIDVLKIQILLRIITSATSTATLQLNWTTNVDFSTPLNPSFGAPAQPLQRTNKPSSLTFAPFPDASKQSQPQPQQYKPTGTSLIGTHPTNRTASTSLQHHSIPTSPPLGDAKTVPLSSILSISFTAPATPAKVGMPFSWQVLIVNNSPKPVRLAIVPLARIQRPTNANQHFAKRHALKASNASTTAPHEVRHQQHHRGGSYAKAVVDEHLLYALHHPAQSSGVSAVPPDTELVSLTAELRIGPLGIGQCHETEIRWVAYKGGVLSVDAVRVVDLAREGEGAIGVIHDIRELPEVVVVGESEDQEVIIGEDRSDVED